jgi:hypothetical protein
MWEAIQYVTGSLTLVAFIAAVAATMSAVTLRGQGRRIEAAPLEDRAKVIEQELGHFPVDTANLSPAEQSRIVLEQIRARSQQYAIRSVVICFLALLFAVVTVFAISRDRKAERETPKAEVPTEPAHADADSAFKYPTTGVPLPKTITVQVNRGQWTDQGRDTRGGNLLSFDIVPPARSVIVSLQVSRCNGCGSHFWLCPDPGHCPSYDGIQKLRPDLWRVWAAADDPHAATVDYQMKYIDQTAVAR